MTVVEYLEAEGMSTHQLSLRARITYRTLRAHVRDGAPLGLDVAKRLEAYDPRMSAAEILGLGKKSA